MIAGSCMLENVFALIAASNWDMKLQKIGKILR